MYRQLIRTVKEAHETLYHFHEPASEEEANRSLARYIATYNSGDHRRDCRSDRRVRDPAPLGNISRPSHRM